MSRKPDAMREISLEMPDRLLKQVEAEAERRGTTLEDIVRLSLRRYVRLPDVFCLDTPMSFGQYKDELIGTLIATEPRYILWCLVNIVGFTLSSQAVDALEAQLPEEGLVVRQYHRSGGYDEIRYVPERDV